MPPNLVQPTNPSTLVISSKHHQIDAETTARETEYHELPRKIAVEGDSVLEQASLTHWVESCRERWYYTLASVDSGKPYLPKWHVFSIGTGVRNKIRFRHN